MKQTVLIISRYCRRSLVAAMTIPLLCCGCGSQLTADRLVGHWHGSGSTGRISAASNWQFNSDGTDTASLSLPQGVLTAQGTWVLQGESLTQRTTDRAIVVGGRQKKTHLSSPLQSTYHCVLTGNSLNLNQPATHETFTLTRDSQ